MCFSHIPHGEKFGQVSQPTNRVNIKAQVLAAPYSQWVYRSLNFNNIGGAKIVMIDIIIRQILFA